MAVIKINNKFKEEDLREKELAKKRKELEQQLFKKQLKREKLIKQYKTKQKIIKIVISLFLAIISICLLIFGTYNTFFKEEKTNSELANIVNKINGESPFKDQGVEGFLKQNINELTKNILSPNAQKNIESYEIDMNSLYITELYKKSYNMANVYFNVTINTLEREKRDEAGVVKPKNHYSGEFTCFIPIRYDFKLGYYQPIGEVEFLSWSTPNKTEIDKNGNPYLDFSGDAEKYSQNSNEYKSAKLFIDNFLQNIYNNNIDVSLEYSGPYKLGREGDTFTGITEMTFYKSTNVEGYNIFIKFKLVTKEGLNIANSSYIKLAKNGDSWKVEMIK